MKMIEQPCQQQQGGSGIIIVDDVIHAAASSPSVASALPAPLGAKVAAIVAKPKSTLVDCEWQFLAVSLQLARVWTQLP